MPDLFNRFVQDENIRNFKRQIAAEKIDLVRLDILKSLLLAEEAKVLMGKPS